MNKIAIRLLVISLLVAVVIVFFLNRLLNKPSFLAELIPSSAVAVVHVNTRDIAKDVYRYGGFTLDSMAFFNEQYPYFSSITDPRNTGIDVYSELFLFQDKVEEGEYHCLLFNLNNLNRFRNFCASNSLLAMANKENKNLYFSKKDSFYVWIKEKEATILFHVKSLVHAKQIMDKISARKENTLAPFKDALAGNNNIAIWQSQSNTLLERDFPFIAGKSTMYGNFKPGKFIFEGEFEKNVANEQHSNLFFFPNMKKNRFSKTIELENKEIHPLSGVIRKWRNQR